MASFNAAWFTKLRSAIEATTRRATFTPTNLRVRHRWTLLFLMLPLSAFAVAQSLRFDIPAQPLPAALKAFADQAKIQLLYKHDAVKGATGNAVVGEFEARDALQILLRGTGLEVIYSKHNAATIRPMQSAAARSLHLAQAGPSPGGEVEDQGNVPSFRQGEGAQSADEVNAEKQTVEEITPTVQGIPEILVTGSKILNMDIERSRDDAQPYVIFERSTIENSGAIDLNDFLRRRLTVNTAGGTYMNSATFQGNRSQINLRGLGARQTLILINGRRTGNESIQTAGNEQYNLNGIPLSAIERIEILPTTASGIHGGSATGGVVNVILRQDYSGIESKLTYDNTFETDAAIRRLDLSGGFTLEGGKTTMLLTGTYMDANPLLAEDRNSSQRARDIQAASNPSALRPPNVPPEGATPNIRSANGSPLFGPGTPSFTSVPEGYAGGGGIDPLRANAGSYNLDLGRIGRTGLANAPTVESLRASIQRRFHPRWQAFIDLNVADNTGHHPRGNSSTFTIAANAPNNPFGQAIQVVAPNPILDGETLAESRQRSAVGGVIVSLPANWRAEADYAWFRSTSSFSSTFPQATPAALTAAIASGALDILRDTRTAPLDFSPYSDWSVTLSPRDSTSKIATVLLGGPLPSFLAGTPQISLKLEHRDEHFGDAIQRSPPSNAFLFPDTSQSVQSIYAEIKLPVLSTLELQLAARHDEYELNSANSSINLNSPTPISRSTNRNRSTNPTVGLRYQPIQDIVLRASYGTGFLPPAVTQILPGPLSASTASLFDPRRGNAPLPTDGTVTTSSELNSRLLPEESDSWSVGTILTPRAVPGLRLSVDYMRIDKTDDITTFPGSFQGIINNEVLFGERVIRGANLPDDPAGWPGPIVRIIGGFFNLARTRVEAWDVQLDYQRRTGALGDFNAFAFATWQPHYQVQTLPGQPQIENAGYSSSNPLEVKANAGLTWMRGRWSAGWNAAWFDSYFIYLPTDTPAAIDTKVLNQGGRARVDSQIYHDLFAGVQFDRPGILTGTRFRIGVKNVFNEIPPLDTTAVSASGSPVIGSFSPFGDPRLRSYYLTVEKWF